MKIIKRILSFLKKHQRFIITAHARADGDALGSELAMADMLTQMGKRSLIVNTGGIFREYLFLPGVRKIKEITKPIKGKYDALIVLDSGGFDRLEWVKAFLPATLPILNIDHHPSNDYFGQINWVEPKMSSVGEMVYRLIKAAGIKMDKRIALNLYVSLITDTGHFCFAATTPYSHKMASDLLNYGIDLRNVFKHIYEDKTYAQVALQCAVLSRMKLAFQGQVAWAQLSRAMYKKYCTTPGETQDYLVMLKSIRGVIIGLLFREMDRPPYAVKVNIRTEPPINANHLARAFGGGGHYRASGCTIYKPLKQARTMVLNHIKSLLAKLHK